MVLIITMYSFMLSIKEFQVFIISTNNSIQQYSFIRTQLNYFKYCYVLLTIRFNIFHLFIPSWIAKQFSSKQFDLALVCTQF